MNSGIAALGQKLWKFNRPAKFFLRGCQTSRSGKGRGHFHLVFSLNEPKGQKRRARFPWRWLTNSLSINRRESQKGKCGEQWKSHPRHGQIRYTATLYQIHQGIRPRQITACLIGFIKLVPVVGLEPTRLFMVPGF
jgi:hypothetical protein